MMELSLTRAPLRHGSDAVPERPLSTLLSRSSSPRATAGLGQQYVFTLPGPIADIAYQNQAVVYDLLLKTAAETLITIAADPKHLGARIGLTAVLHTWGSTLTHHRMPTSSSREAASLPMASAGSPAGSAFSSPFRCSHASSAACSSKG